MTFYRHDYSMKNNGELKPQLGQKNNVRKITIKEQENIDLAIHAHPSIFKYILTFFININYLSLFRSHL
jgi:hypothetical protein